MSAAFEYETPENVVLSYQIAGVGSRFLAWVLDMMLLTFSMIVLLVIFIIFAAMTESLWLEQFTDYVDRSVESEEDLPQLLYVVAGIWLLIWGLGSFVYFSVLELRGRGQSLGKKMSSIRVVKASGFSLDPTSIYLRNIFRVIDQIPVLWIVPMLNKRGQRFGDMVSGTIVIEEQQLRINPFRAKLLELSDRDLMYRFTGSMLNELTSDQISGLEQICERWQSLSETKRDILLNKIIPPICQKLKLDTPDINNRYQFLTDLLHAEYKRQERKLG